MHLTRKRAYASPVSTPLSVKAALREVGFQRKVRWNEVKPVLKQLIVAARRSGDNEQVLVLNVLHAYLKRQLYRTCAQAGCRLPTKGIHCYVHSLDRRYPVRGTAGR